jgi:hypothetical protein
VPAAHIATHCKYVTEEVLPFFREERFYEQSFAKQTRAGPGK